VAPPLHTLKVRFIDYPKQYRKIRGEILRTVDTVLSRGDVMLRQQLRDFEASLAVFIGAKFAIGTSNCTDALHLVLRALGVGKGDEVVTVSHTFVATLAAIHHVGAKPVLVDIGEDHNMDVEKIEAAVTPRTKAILPVHLNGRLCNMKQIMKSAKKHGLHVVEDAAQALGASFNGRKAGSFGIAGCFSFYPAKLLGAYGDGGALVTNDEEIAKKVTLLRNHGRMPDGSIAGWSFNCRLDNLQAALLSVKLKKLHGAIVRRRRVASLYHRHLGKIPQLSLPPPPTDKGVYYDVFQNYEIEAESRDDLVTHLTARGVEIMLPWGGKGVHQFPSLDLSFYSLPCTERLFNNVLLLPMHPDLSDRDVRYVCKCIVEFYGYR